MSYRFVDVDVLCVLAGSMLVVTCALSGFMVHVSELLLMMFII